MLSANIPRVYWNVTCLPTLLELFTFLAPFYWYSIKSIT